MGPFEKALQAMGADQRAITAVYEEAERRSAASGEFIFLGHVFDQVKEPAYIDWVHLAPRGNELVAQAIANRLLLDLPKEAPRATISRASPASKAH